MKTRHAQVPPWAYEGKTPGVLTFFEAMALAGLEEQALWLDARTQRQLLGYPIFGRRRIEVLKAGVVRMSVPVCFGTDREVAVYSARVLAEAAAAGLALHPAVEGPGYFAKARSSAGGGESLYSAEDTAYCNVEKEKGR